ncbi:diacylglycerol/lipid kinase family protein [Bradyrhizobium lupini]
MITRNDRQVSDRRAEKEAIEREIKGIRRAVLIVNTRSRRGAANWSEAKEQLLQAGIVLDGVYPVRNAEKLPDIVRDEIAKGQKLIIVGGGDGTVSSVARHFRDRGVVLGLLPLGTANSFARALGIPLDLQGAIDVLVDGKVADVDLGTINESRFVNGSSIGMPSIVGRATPHVLKKYFGRAAYALVAAGKFLRFKPFLCVVTASGVEHVFEALDVRIASGGYQGGVLVAREAKPDDGTIMVQILTGPSKWTMAKEWGRRAFGAPVGAANTVCLKAPEFLIDTDPSQHVSVDGEVITQTPVHVAVARNALLLMTPNAFIDRDEATQRPSAS